MEGETLPRFDSKSRMFGNVKYPREHRMPGYTQKAAFFIKRSLLDALVYNIIPFWYMPVYWSEQYTCDFSPYLRHIFAVKHIYLTLYIVYVLRISPIYSVPACSRACSLRLLSVRPCPCAPADTWSTVDFLVRRPCAACLACPRACSLALAVPARCGRRPSGPIASGRSPSLRPCGRARSRARPRARARARARVCARPRACAWARAWPRLLPLFAPIMAHFIRLYGSFSRRASARWACRKLF